MCIFLNNVFGGILVVLFVFENEWKRNMIYVTQFNGSLEASAFQVTILWHMYNLSQVGVGCFDVLIIAIQIDVCTYLIENCV